MFFEIVAVVSAIGAGAAYLDRKNLKTQISALVSKVENKESAVKADVKAKLDAIVADAKAEAEKVATTAKSIVGKIEADIEAKI